MSFIGPELFLGCAAWIAQNVNQDILTIFTEKGGEIAHSPENANYLFGSVWDDETEKITNELPDALIIDSSWIERSAEENQILNCGSFILAPPFESLMEKVIFEDKNRDKKPEPDLNENRSQESDNEAEKQDDDVEMEEDSMEIDEIDEIEYIDFPEVTSIAEIESKLKLYDFISLSNYRITQKKKRKNPDIIENQNSPSKKIKL